MKKLLRAIFYNRPTASVAVNLALRLHNFAYALASVFAPHAESNGLHPKHRIMNYHDWFLANLDPAWTVLDVGCGNGALLQSIAGKVARVVGVDISARNVAAARKRVPGAKIHHADATVQRFDETFDAVVLSNVLEHIESRVPFLKALGGLAPRILVRVPLINREWIVPYKKERGMEYRLDSTHFIEYYEPEFNAEIEAAGFKIVSQETRWGELYALVERR